MLEIEVMEKLSFDESKGEFVQPVYCVLQLEHSLVSLSKWEAKFKKPYLTDQERSLEEAFGYIECMILNDDYPPDALSKLSDDNVNAIVEYMNDSMTATWFNEIQPSPQGAETITNELIYFWMDSASISWEAQHWHLNRLFTLIKVHGAKSSQPKKMSHSEAAERRRRLNAQRKAAEGNGG